MGVQIPYQHSAEVWIRPETGLSCIVADAIALVPQDQLKYSYMFAQPAKKAKDSRSREPQDEEAKSDVQSYINEILGVKGDKTRAEG